MKAKYGIFTLIFLLGCGHEVKQAQQKQMNGINGEAFYVFAKDGSIRTVFKEKFNVHEYAVLLVKDTIKLGEDFTSLINVANPNYVVTISSPSNFIIKGDGTYGIRKYNFVPSTPGTFDYKGIIEYDSLRVPFDYKFIVTGADKEPNM